MEHLAGTALYEFPVLSQMMNIQPECFPCLLRRSLYETNLVNPELGYEVMKVAADVLLCEFSENANSAEVATKVHRAVYDLLGTDDPYREIKKRSNEVALKLYPRAEELVRESDNPFKAAVICSIAGNVLDFGIKSRISGPDELEPIFENIYAEGLGHDDTP
ncbi:MAG: ARMT1-like domain-containing protein, partial [Thermoplasmata archaeon]